MASERVTVHRERELWLDDLRLYVTETYEAAVFMADRLNAAFDEVEKKARADERQKLLDEKKCCAVHRATELISGLGCGRCHDTFHCPVCCMEAVLEEACEAEEARADERVICRQIFAENSVDAAIAGLRFDELRSQR